jgi:hypothetical protein
MNIPKSGHLLFEAGAESLGASGYDSVDSGIRGWHSRELK